MRDTPETDAEAERLDFKVDLNFARKLERERDEARKELEEYRSIAESIGAKKAVSEKEKAIRERDEARKEIEFLKKTPLQQRCQQLEREIDHWCDMHTIASKQRDEAREALEEENKFHSRTHKELVQTQCKLMDVTQAIIDTLEENRHLADGDDCTLAKLKSVVPDWK